MTSGNREGVEAEVARILRERVARFQAGVDALAREVASPASLPHVTDAPAGSGDATQPLNPGFLSIAARALAGSEDQVALLDRLLEGAARCCSRTCLFLVRDEKIYGWSSVGFPEAEDGDPARGLRAELAENPLLLTATRERRCIRADVSAARPAFLPPPQPGDRLPRLAIAAPLVVRDRVPALLYADDGGDGRSSSDFDGVEVLTQLAALVAGGLSGRRRAETPAPARAGRETPAASPSLEAESAAPLLPDPLEEELGLPPSAPDPVPGDLSADEAVQHEHARRLARLLVSELLLYYEDQVILGRRQRDLTERLGVEIERSRQAYDQRVPRAITDRKDYFQEEIVRTLAQGDATALGAPPAA